MSEETINVRYVASDTKEGIFYRVETIELRRQTCTCPGFRNHGHCKHTED